jgi:hypothetical protein
MSRLLSMKSCLRVPVPEDALVTKRIKTILPNNNVTSQQMKHLKWETHRLAKRLARCECPPSSRCFVGAGEDEDGVVDVVTMEDDKDVGGVAELDEKLG